MTENSYLHWTLLHDCCFFRSMLIKLFRLTPALATTVSLEMLRWWDESNAADLLFTWTGLWSVFGALSCSAADTSNTCGSIPPNIHNSIGSINKIWLAIVIHRIEAFPPWKSSLLKAQYSMLHPLCPPTMKSLDSVAVISWQKQWTSVNVVWRGDSPSVLYIISDMSVLYIQPISNWEYNSCNQNTYMRNKHYCSKEQN